ncbi:S8 family serine peptidase, partial [Cesiribacter andamanensis]|uniref:S8 family serine peptidase n=1 Tax=Cesiribacter andamanensis TaxID=649507 RepID=UPI00058D6CCB
MLISSTYALSNTPETAPPPQPGQLLVKLKPEFAYLNADGQSMRADAWKRLAPSLSVKNAVAFSSFRPVKGKAAARRQATPSGLDMRLYHQLSFDPALPLEQATTELLKSGMVELAEPVHTAIPYALPNDPLLASQRHLALIKAAEAWQISTGSPEVIIAIIDTGMDLTHPDLLDNLYRNEADPIDGLDNDGDGFIDNYWGWDFAGDDFASMGAGDHDPHGSAPNLAHGTRVAGAASATANNGIGVAGIGYQAKLMALKHTAENDTRHNGGGFLINLLQGVLYAATQGAHIINASYGTTFYSQIAHDVYRHVALEYGVLVVAAAGNSNYPGAHYPSDYDFVLSVAASTMADGKAQFSNYGYGVALSAPGEGCLPTQ